MSERKDEEWLDDQLQRAVDGTTPVFDAQAWKQKHRAEYEVLLSRGSRSGPSVSRASRTVRAIFGNPFTALAAAAAVIVAATIFFAGRTGRNPKPSEIEVRQVARAPAEMVTLLSLRVAYQQGGIDALDRQLDHAWRLLGPRPGRIVSWQALEDSEG
jgi:hypothetical protein